MVLESEIRGRLEANVAEVENRAAETGKSSVYCIGTTMNVGNDAYFFSSIRECDEAICGNIMIVYTRDLPEIVAILDGRVDEIWADIEKKRGNCVEMDDIIRRVVVKSKIGFFRGNDVAASAFEKIFLSFCREKRIDFSRRRACVVGAGHLGAKVVAILVELGLYVDVSDIDGERARSVAKAANIFAARECKGSACGVDTRDIADRRYLLIAGATNGIPVISESMLAALEPDGFVMDMGLKTIYADAIELLRTKGMPVFCLIAKPGFDGMVKAFFNAEAIAKTVGRRDVEEGFSLVSGGIVGGYGDVIVDDVNHPTRVIGVAHGDGLVLQGVERNLFADRIECVKNQYIKRES